MHAYHKKNSGVSEARNFGLDRANGDYISFCDSDDFIDKEMYYKLYSIMKKNNTDRVCGGYLYLYKDNHIVRCTPRIKDGKYPAKKILCRMIDDGTMSGVLFSGVNNSLFKKSIIDKYRIRFNKSVKYNEDSLFSITYMIHSTSIYSIQSQLLYYYRQYEDSSTGKRKVGNVYEPFHSALFNLGLTNEEYLFDLQMKRRAITETLWQILDISKKEKAHDGILQIRNLLQQDKFKSNIIVIRPSSLNKYKRVYWFMMKNKMAISLYVLSGKIVPIVSKYISR